MKSIKNIYSNKNLGGVKMLNKIMIKEVYQVSDQTSIPGTFCGGGQTSIPGTFHGGGQTSIPGTFHGGSQTSVPGTFH